ncbi:unnamed protein product [Cyclocybe aegerita]|uniref:RING-type domain-containing protein n=1 Tax=Cyclocybe aegerita TaxID=1973307 RepID=A0A8S0VQ95_CYCAE|nr:unnamed protein product [Cyclocybe aegerita]
MPATRSSSIPPRAAPFPTASPPHHKHHNHAKSPVYELSFSSSEGESSRTAPTKKHIDKPSSRTMKATHAAPPHIAEIIEISSDDDDDMPPKLIPQASAIAEYRREINKMRADNVKQKRDLEKMANEVKALREENEQLQALQKPTLGKISLDAAQLTDHLECEICTSKMWTPYILPDCGHTFCESCLQDWFSTTQAKYIAAHPEYNPNTVLLNNNATYLVNLAQSVAHNPHAANHAHIGAIIDQLLPPHPQYTCPTCREPVRSRPTEAFALKAIVRTISAATGESSPTKPATSRKGKTTATTVGPWDGFFPRKKT